MPADAGAGSHGFPAIEELVPHAGPMVLLEEVLEHGAESTTCRAFIGEDAIFAAADGSVPAWAGIEYMAQCIAVHAGLVARAGGEAPRVGFLVGSRRVELHTAAVPRGTTLDVSARHLRGRTGALVFDCEIRVAPPIREADGGEAAVRGEGALLAKGSLNIIVPDSLEPWQSGMVQGQGPRDGAGDAKGRSR